MKHQNVATPYDRVAYPSAIFPRTHPDRLAVIALLHGLTPPDIASARTLEMGCGDGLNLCSLAAAHPQAQFEGFDLSEVAISRGNELVTSAGLTNIKLSVLDALQASECYAAASFDYVIAHGLYAWVPGSVREAVMALMGKVLSPHGVGFISYNALPGGHLRQIMRDMLLHEIGGADDPEEKIQKVRRFLETLKVAQENDDPALTAIRSQASKMLERPDGVLFHDELGPDYAPQSFSAVVAAADKVGLRFLSDSGRERQLDGFLPDEVPDDGDAEAQIIRTIQTGDYLSMRFFRQTLIVRAACRPLRRIELARLDQLWMAAHLPRDEEGAFKSGEDRIDVGDEALAGVLDRLTAHWPDWMQVRDAIEGRDRRMALLQLFSGNYVDLHTSPPPFNLHCSEVPCVSPVVRAQLSMQSPMVCCLNHHVLSIDQPELRALLLAADGTRTVAELCQMTSLGLTASDIQMALEAGARRALMLA